MPYPFDVSDTNSLPPKITVQFHYLLFFTSARAAIEYVR